MKQREKFLLIGLVAAVLLWQGSGLVSGIFIAPITERQDRIEAIQKRIEDKKFDVHALRRANSDLASWNLRSLPPDRLFAASAYQTWLYELAVKSGFKGVSVLPPQADQRLKDDTYFAVTANVDGQGTLANLCDFMHAFHQSGLLHRIQMVRAISDKHEGDPQLRLSIRVEALCLKDAPARTTLFAKTDKPLVPDKPLKPRADYNALVKKNPFVKGYNGPPRPPEPPRSRTNDSRPTDTKDPVLDPAEFTYLISYVSSNDLQEVWLYDRSSNQQTILTEGSEFEVGDVKGRVVLISKDFIQILKDGELWDLELGKNLREMTKVAKPKK